MVVQAQIDLKYKLEFQKFFKIYFETRKAGENAIFCGDVNISKKQTQLLPKRKYREYRFLPIERAWIDKVIKNNLQIFLENLSKQQFVHIRTGIKRQEL